MTGPQHYQLAEQLLDMASDDELDSDVERFHQAQAQVHATLALAAAIGMGMAAAEPADAAVRAWYEAAGTRTEVTE